MLYLKNFQFTTFSHKDIVNSIQNIEHIWFDSLKNAM
jgi:hypothetical protein